MAAPAFIEMANQLYKEAHGDLSPHHEHRGIVKGHLNRLFQTYGEFVENNHYLFCYDPAVIQVIFNRLRGWTDGVAQATPAYPTAIGSYGIQRIRDLTIGYDTSTADHRPLLPVSPSTQMITYWFENGTVCTLRTSGTEPKIKYYVEKRGVPGQAREEVLRELKAMVAVLIELSLEPERNGLTRP